eukprot:766783-Hanusia_phi.AAC.6
MSMAGQGDRKKRWQVAIASVVLVYLRLGTTCDCCPIYVMCWSTSQRHLMTSKTTPQSPTSHHDSMPLITHRSDHTVHKTTVTGNMMAESELDLVLY